MELLPIGSKGRTEVLSDAANQGIEAINQLKIEIEFSDGKGSDIILELLQGFRSDAPGTAGQDKSQEGITLWIGSDRCAFGDSERVRAAPRRVSTWARASSAWERF